MDDEEKDLEQNEEKIEEESPADYIKEELEEVDEEVAKLDEIGKESENEQEKLEAATESIEEKPEAEEKGEVGEESIIKNLPPKETEYKESVSEPVMVQSTSVQKGLEGFGKEEAQAEMFGEVSGKESHAEPLIEFKEEVYEPPKEQIELIKEEEPEPPSEEPFVYEEEPSTKLTEEPIIELPPEPEEDIKIRKVLAEDKEKAVAFRNMDDDTRNAYKETLKRRINEENQIIDEYGAKSEGLKAVIDDLPDYKFLLPMYRKMHGRGDKEYKGLTLKEYKRVTGKDNPRHVSYDSQGKPYVMWDEVLDEEANQYGFESSEKLYDKLAELDDMKQQVWDAKLLNRQADKEKKEYLRSLNILEDITNTPEIGGTKYERYEEKPREPEPIAQPTTALTAVPTPFNFFEPRADRGELKPVIELSAQTERPAEPYGRGEEGNKGVAGEERRESTPIQPEEQSIKERGGIIPAADEEEKALSKLVDDAIYEQYGENIPEQLKKPFIVRILPREKAQEFFSNEIPEHGLARSSPTKEDNLLFFYNDAWEALGRSENRIEAVKDIIKHELLHLETNLPDSADEFSKLAEERNVKLTKQFNLKIKPFEKSDEVKKFLKENGFTEDEINNISLRDAYEYVSGKKEIPARNKVEEIKPLFGEELERKLKEFGQKQPHKEAPFISGDYDGKKLDIDIKEWREIFDKMDEETKVAFLENNPQFEEMLKAPKPQEEVKQEMPKTPPKEKQVKPPKIEELKKHKKGTIVYKDENDDWVVVEPPYTYKARQKSAPDGVYKTNKKSIQVINGKPRKETPIVDLGFARVKLTPKGEVITEYRQVNGQNNVIREFIPQPLKTFSQLGLRKVELPQFKAANLRVYLVNGDYIRQRYSIPFINGGNDKTLPSLIPQNEIWVEQTPSIKQMKRSLLYQLIERRKISQEHKDYITAYNETNAEIKQLENDINGLDRNLNFEVRMNPELSPSFEGITPFARPMITKEGALKKRRNRKGVGWQNNYIIGYRYLNHKIPETGIMGNI
jgi:hypothetical protein